MSDLPEGEILSPLHGRRFDALVRIPRVRVEMEPSVRWNGALGEVEPALRGGGLPLPGLKQWRMRKGINQAELARRPGLSSDYLFNVESGRRACRPEAAELLADLVGVSLAVLRRKPGAAFDMETSPKPDRPRVAYRHVHQDYLKIILEGAVGSAYAAMDERELEERCEGGTWGEALEIVQARKREIEFLGKALEAGGRYGILICPRRPRHKVRDA